MFSIDNILFLLSSADDFSSIQQQRLIIPGIIFSVGAIMLIICVLVSNIQRRKKLADAERMKRERIKKFSEEANMRYSAADTEANLRQRKIVTENLPVSNIQNQTANVPVTPNINQQNVVPNMQGIQTPVMPQGRPVAPIMPGMSQAPVMNTPAQSVPVQPQMNVVPQQPAMNNNYVPVQNNDAAKSNIQQDDNIAETIRKRIQEIENKKREELASKNSSAAVPSIPSSDTSPVPAPVASESKPQTTEAENNNNSIDEQNKPKEKKEFKFEYKPDYKPGQEPASEEKIELSLKQEETKSKEVENKKEEVEDKKSDAITQIKNLDDEEKIETKNEDENVNVNKSYEVTKAPKVITERSSEFVEAEKISIKKEIPEQDLEAKNIIERIPQVPKITSKKVDYNVGYLREVQSKLNSSREYEEAISFKEEEKNKLKEELLEKRMNLEKVKSKLREEKNKAEETKRLTKEEISKSLLEQTETGIVYEEGKKVSLFDNDSPTQTSKQEQPKEEKVPEVKNEVKEEIKKEVIEDKNVNNQNDIYKSKASEIIQRKLQNKKSDSEITDNTKEEQTNNLSEDEKAKKQKDVFTQLDALFSDNDTVENANKKMDEADFKQRLKDKLTKDRLKEIVKETKKEEALENVKPTKLEEDVAKVKANMAALTAASTAYAAGKISNDNNEIKKETLKEQKQEIKPQVQNQNPNTDDDDPIRARIRAKVEEERKRKEELLKQEQEAKEEKLKEKQKTKSILNGIDIEQEILQNKANKKVTSFDDAPDYKKIIAVVSTESLGKTTVATNLAYELANRGLKVCLIDTDNIKKDIYYYINEEKVGCLSRLNEFEDADDMYELGIKVNDRLTVFTENKGIEFEINYSKLFKLINLAQKKNDAVIIDVKQSLGQEKTKDLLKLSTNILMVIDKKITTLNRVAEKFAKIKGGFVNKDITVAVNMDEGRGINKAAVKSIFKHLEYMDNGEKKAYSIKVGEIFTIAYDTKSIITGLISQLPAVTVPENKIISDMKNIASHYFETNNK